MSSIVQPAKTIFIAHAHSDRDLADAVGKEVRRALEGKIGVFCTSTPATIAPGKKWLTELEETLASAQAVIALITPASVGKSWLWFEIGAAWLKANQGNCTIYPLRVRQIPIQDLPPPLDQIQSVSLDDAAGLKAFIDELTRQFAVGSPSAFRPAQIIKRLPASWVKEDEDEETVLGFSPLHFAWKVISDHGAFRFVDEDGEAFSDEMEFRVFTQLVLGVLQTEKPESGFSDEYVYMRVWKAFRMISREYPIYFHPMNFRSFMEVLRLVGVVRSELAFWSIAPLGWDVLAKCPQRYSAEELDHILQDSDEKFESPSLEEADEFLFRGAIKRS